MFNKEMNKRACLTCCRNISPASATMTITAATAVPERGTKAETFLKLAATQSLHWEEAFAKIID